MLGAGIAPLPSHAADALTVVRLGLLSSDNSANAYYAQELGYFKNAGLDVQITTLHIDAALEVEPFVTNDKGVERVLGSALDGLGPHVMILKGPRVK